MLDKSTHPFIVNTLESNNHWELSIKKGSSGCWWAALLYDSDESEAEPGNTLPEALDRLESVLAGREYVESSAAVDPDHEAYFARWKGAPAGATHLAQDDNGVCCWYESEPIMDERLGWRNSAENGGVWRAGLDLLGSVRCEPRPKL